MQTDEIHRNRRVVALAGGVGGAKLADGLARCVPADHLTVIVNTGDDFTHWGLNISPDLDTVCYTLANLANPATGWGRVDESWNVFEQMSLLGAESWFRLGDKDLATHLERTRRLKSGEPLSSITRDFCRRWGVDSLILPMSDTPVATMVLTQEQGELAFQEYFVHQHCEPTVRNFRFAGMGQAQPTPGVLEALQAADILIICPSNPWVSVDPILGILKEKVMLPPVRVAVSPIIGGKTVKGPAAKMFAELGIEPSALAVAKHYGNALLNGYIFDTIDQEQTEDIKKLGITPFCTQTLMHTPENRQQLAQEILHFTETLL